MDQIQSQLKLSRDNLDSLIIDKESKIELIKHLESERSLINSELTKIREQELHIQHKIEAVEKDLSEWEDVRTILDGGQDQIKERRELEQKYESLNYKLSVLQNLELRFSRLTSLEEQDLFIFPQGDMQLIYKSLEDKTTILTQAQKQLQMVENLMGELNSLFSRLQNLGRDFIKIDEKSTTCPLCKHNHGSRIKLIKAIQSTGSSNEQDDNGLDVLRQSIEDLITDINNLNIQLNNQNLNRQNVEQVAEAYMVLEMDSQFDIVVGLKNPKEQLQTIQNFLTKQNKWKKQRETVNIQLKLLDERGFSNNIIIRAEFYKNQSQLYRQYIEEQSTDSFEVFAIAFHKKMQNKAIVLNHISEQYRNQDAELQKRILGISFEELNKSITEQEKQISILNYFEESLVTLRKDFQFDKDDNLRSWAIQLETARRQIELIVERYRYGQQQIQIQSKLREVEASLLVYQNMIQRCQSACNVLEQLRSLKTYTEDFINKNISRIERFFNLLHTPREFDEVRLEEDGLVLHRKGQQEGCSVKAFQMSSGQRASLALSVMFAVHLAAPNAPKFIIMDEPVSNMDDLHLMNLLDLLRDLALSGRQIFFTTANPDVANLFRRKFSFLADQFTHFEFLRHSGNPVEIQIIKYTPDKENPVICTIGY